MPAGTYRERGQHQRPHTFPQSPNRRDRRTAHRLRQQQPSPALSCRYQEAQPAAHHAEFVHPGCPVSVGGQPYFASTSRDRTVRIWEPSTGAEVARIPLRTEVFWLGCEQDALMGIFGNGEVRRWDIHLLNATPEQLGQMRSDFFPAERLDEVGVTVAWEGLDAFSGEP